MQQASEADRETYAELLKYGTSVVAHLGSIRGRPVVPPSRNKLLGAHDARRVTDSLRSTLPKEKFDTQEAPVHFVFRRAPPCSVSVSELKKVYITDLKWSEVHRGNVIVLRNISTPRKSWKEGGAIVLVVEDEHGSALILRLFNFTLSSDSSLDHLLAQGAVFAVKEPYCEAASEATSGLRIDHPSDIAFLDEGHFLFPKEWVRTFGTGVSPAETLKEEGNTAFKKGEYDVAVLRYKEALSHSPDSSLRHTLLLNSAQANLQRRNPFAAYSDCAPLLSLPSSPYALASSLSPIKPTAAADLTPKDSEKALYRASRALYSLQLYSSALPILEALLKLVPTNRDARALSDRTNQRLREEKEGKYEWDTLLKESKGHAPRTEVADYVGPVIISTSGDENKSRVWRATRDIKAGELVLASRALAVYYPPDPSSARGVDAKKGLVFDATRAQVGAPEGWELTRRIAEYISGDPGGKKACLALGLAGSAPAYDARLGEEVREDEAGEGVKVVDGQAVVDMNVLDTIRTPHSFPFKAIPALLPAAAKQGTGLAFNPAVALTYLSHSCIPNSALLYIADLGVVRAAQPISCGQAITVAFTLSSAPKAERWAELERMGGSGERKCTCRLCEIEDEEGDGPRARRVELVQKVKVLADRAPTETLRTGPLVDSEPTNRPKEDDVLQITKDVEKIVDELDATFTFPAKDQPRFAMLDPLGYIFACYLYLGQEYTEKAIRANMRYIAALGWEAQYASDVDASMPKEKEKGKGRAKTTKDDGPDFFITSYGTPFPPLVRVLVQQSSVFWQLGKRRTAAAWRREAEKFSEVVGCTKVIFKEAYGDAYETLGWKS